MSPRHRRVAGALALALASLGCQKSGAVECTPPPVVACPDGGGPSFEADVYPNVFAPDCATCHSPTGIEPSSPLTNYQQIYGSGGSEAREIYNQVLENCLMPPGNGPEPLSEPQRQTLLVWYACGALDSPAAVDAGGGD
ncbi:MAG TPA: hypothetical protein VH853_25260 [Polyangia bacterium]|nr:hypothetical protein [Polyangia bacterium]